MGSITFPCWYQVDFNGTKSIEEINVFAIQSDSANLITPTQSMTTNYANTAFEVQYWNGSTWIAVPGGTFTNNNKVWNQILLTTPITTTKIRVYITQSSTTYAYLAEVEAFGDGRSFGGVPAIPASGQARAWFSRNRLIQNTILKQTDASVAPETNTTYTIKIYGENNQLLRTASQLTSLQYDYTAQQELTDTGLARLQASLKFEVFAVRNGLSSNIYPRTIVRI